MIGDAAGPDAGSMPETARQLELAVTAKPVDEPAEYEAAAVPPGVEAAAAEPAAVEVAVPPAPAVVEAAVVPPLPEPAPGEAAGVGGGARPAAFRPFSPYRGLIRRFLVVHRHFVGLLAGGLVAYARSLPPARRRGIRAGAVRLAAALVRPFLDREIARLTFPQQLRRRLELIGPTYVKLGQIMAVREDLLPVAVCRELQHLFDHVPAMPFPEVRSLIELRLRRPVEKLFRRIDEEPLGSASIAQAHYAETLVGEPVVLKVMRPGIRETVASDLRLLQLLGALLQLILPRYQPRRIIREFAAYTIREVDFRYEADAAEMFLTNFRDMPGIVFPRVYRELSTPTLLTLEFIEGMKPGAPAVAQLSPAERERLIDLGAGAIIRMLYQDGFFHADLHAGNLLILRGEEVRLGFIDLGMVGRFEERTRRRMLYYFHSLVTGDVEGAAKFLADMASVDRGGDLVGFRRAVTDLSRRFLTHAGLGDFSIAKLILESVALGGRFRVFFPVEMTLMVKALVTFEGVGRMLDPRLDVAAVSRRHVAHVFQRQFAPQTLARELMRGVPELIDVAVQLPQLLVASSRLLEESLSRRAPENPMRGMRSALLASACLVAGVIALGGAGPPFLWILLFTLAAVLAVAGR